MRISRILAGLAAAATLLTAPAALAQRMDVVVFDEARLIQESQAGQSIKTQLEQLAQAAQTELQSEAQRLQSQGQALQASKDSLGEEEFQRRARGLVQSGQVLQNVRSEEIAQAEAQAMQELGRQLEPALEEVAKRRRAEMVLRRSQVAWLSDDADVTGELVQALDRRVTTIEVTKPDLMGQIRAAQAAQAAQAGQAQD